MKTVGFICLILSAISLVFVAILGVGDSRSNGFGGFLLWGILGLVLITVAERGK